MDKPIPRSLTKKMGMRFAGCSATAPILPSPEISISVLCSPPKRMLATFLNPSLILNATCRYLRAIAFQLPWDVLVAKHMLPDHSLITGFEEALQQMAERYGGRNDGWGCMS